MSYHFRAFDPLKGRHHSKRVRRNYSSLEKEQQILSLQSLERKNKTMDIDTEAKIKDHYNKGQGSIQDIARVYNVTVEAVLEAIGQSEMTEVVMQGDLIDQREAGPEVTVTPFKKERVPFSTN